MFEYDSDTDSAIEKENPSDVEIPDEHRDSEHKTGLGPLQVISIHVYFYIMYIQK